MEENTTVPPAIMEWVQRGDRSHPNLIELDGLNLLSYPGWEKDVKTAEQAHTEGTDIHLGICRLLEAQRVYDGNRSHWRLVTLDSLEISYPGWEEDVKKAERFHICRVENIISNFGFDRMVMEFKGKQQLFQGDRSHPNLQKLDALQPTKSTYPGWNEDFTAAEKDHQNRERFNHKLFILEERQRMYLGDRSHPRLLELDSYSFSYPGWEEDIRLAEDIHLRMKHSFLIYHCHLQGMRNKQQMCLGDRSHPNLVFLDGLLLSYPSWKADFIQAEKAHQKGSAYRFETQVEILKERQKLFLGDRSHPNLVTLDELKLSYPGWQVDIEKAEKFHLSRKSDFISEVGFKRMVEGMRNKQQLFDGYHDSGESNDTQDGTSIPATMPSPQGTCVVCMTSRSTHALVPCGHFCLCGECSAKTMGRGCPICRQRVHTSVKIFFS
jgi:hypothetical protein